VRVQLTPLFVESLDQSIERAIDRLSDGTLLCVECAAVRVQFVFDATSTRVELEGGQ